MSHYGRHGSRYLEKESIIDDVIGPLETASRHDNLTAVGEMLLSDLYQLDALSDGLYGQITEKGARELTCLGSRCAERFPEIFRNKDRNVLCCVASPRPRCITSMSNYISSVLRVYPGLATSYHTGDKYLDYIARTRNLGPFYKKIREEVDARYRAEFDASRLCSALFVKPEIMDFNPWHFSEMLFHCAADVSCIEADLDIFRYLTPDEMRTLHKLYNNRVCCTHANSALSAAERLPEAYDLVDDFISRAEDALAGNEVAADFRFGHDSGLMPLITIFNIEGWDIETTLDNAHLYWNASLRTPMASNFQMIFYKSSKSDVILVKLLLNEKEVRVSGLESFCGPYYKWNGLKQHLQARICTAGL